MRCTPVFSCNQRPRAERVHGSLRDYGPARPGQRQRIHAQLDPARQEFIQNVLQRAEGVDGWTIYRALSKPCEVLEGRSPVEAVNMQNRHETASAVFSAMGLN